MLRARALRRVERAGGDRRHRGGREPPRAAAAARGLRARAEAGVGVERGVLEARGKRLDLGRWLLGPASPQLHLVAVALGAGARRKLAAHPWAVDADPAAPAASSPAALTSLSKIGRFD